MEFVTLQLTTIDGYIMSVVFCSNRTTKNIGNISFELSISDVYSSLYSAERINNIYENTYDHS